MRSIGWVHVAVVLGAMAAAPGATPVVSAPIEAVAVARHDLRLGFTVPGRVTEVLVEPGQHVEAGQALARLDDRETLTQVEVYTLRAESDLEIQAAEAELGLAQNEEARIRDAFNKSAAGVFEVERAALESRRRKMSVELARQRREEALAQLALARIRHEQNTLRAPIAGKVEQVLIASGEMVEALKPILRLVVTDPLRIEAAVPTSTTLGLEPGDRAVVRLVLPEEDEPLAGRVVHIAQVADPASDTRIVRIEAANPRGLPAGCRVLVEFPGRKPADGTSPSAAQR